MTQGHAIAREAIFSQIVNVIRDGEPLTLRAVATRADLSLTTARKYVNDLASAGAVITRQLEGNVRLYSVQEEEPAKPRTLAD